MGVNYGLKGSLFRGATAVGFSVPCALSLSAVQDGMRNNPLASSFELKVNPYVVDKAESIAESFQIEIKVIPTPSFGAEEWLLCPKGDNKS